MARREALLDAATECFLESGYGVSLEKIAERAGVGRGTLYRNFEDRADLALAIFSREIEGAFGHLDPAAPVAETFTRLIHQSKRANALFFRLAADLPMMCERRSAFDALAQQVETLLEPVAQGWRAAGIIHPSVSAGEVVMATRMVSVLFMTTMGAQEFDERLSQAMRIVFEGLASGRGRPVEAGPAAWRCGA